MKKAITFLLMTAFLFIAVTTPLTCREFASGPIRVTERISMLELLLSPLAVHASIGKRRISLGAQRWDNVVGVWPCVAKVEKSDWWAIPLRDQFGQVSIYVLNTNGSLVVHIDDRFTGGAAWSLGTTNDPELRLVQLSESSLLCVKKDLSDNKGKVVIHGRTNIVQILPR